MEEFTDTIERTHQEVQDSTIESDPDSDQHEQIVDRLEGMSHDEIASWIRKLSEDVHFLGTIAAMRQSMGYFQEILQCLAETRELDDFASIEELAAYLSEVFEGIINERRKELQSDLGAERFCELYEKGVDLIDGSGSSD